MRRCTDETDERPAPACIAACAGWRPKRTEWQILRQIREQNSAPTNIGGAQTDGAGPACAAPELIAGRDIFCRSDEPGHHHDLRTVRRHGARIAAVSHACLLY